MVVNGNSSSGEVACNGLKKDELKKVESLSSMPYVYVLFSLVNKSNLTYFIGGHQKQIKITDSLIPNLEKALESFAANI